MSNLTSYRRRGRKFWAIDVWVKTPAGPRRVREREIPTKEQAKARLSQAYADAYEGRAFRISKPVVLTVAGAWDLYAKVAKRENRSWKSDRARAKRLLEHLGKRAVVELHQGDVDAYRTLRSAETTARVDEEGEPRKPSPATLDREVELLKRLLGYAVRCGKLPANPLAGVALLRVSNVRDVVVDDEAFERLLVACQALDRRSAWMWPVLLVSYDTGMRIGEVLHLVAARVDRKTGLVRLRPQDTKTEEGRAVYLQARTLEALKLVPRVLGSPWLFAHPTTKRPRTVPRRGFHAALRAAGLEGVHVHDLRRSFATLARKRGIPESVVMKCGGWKTSSVFRRYNIVDCADLQQAARVMEEARKVGQHPAKVADPAETSRKKTE